MTEPRLSAEQIQDLVSYLPPRVARIILSDPGYTTRPAAAHMEAALLLADISGFTALTERLAGRRPEGAEELTALLNAYFSRMIELLTEEGGDVVQFSGDALLATFAYDDEPLGLSVRRAWQAAVRMQAAMAEFSTLQTSVGPVELGMKIAIGAGDIVALSIGGILNRWQYIIAGDPLRQVAEGEAGAPRGAIVLSPAARDCMRAAGVEPRPRLPPRLSGPSEQLLAALSTHIPGAVNYRLLDGQLDWLAELRRMSVLFLGIGGLSYESPADLAALQSTMMGFQQTIYRYEGSLNKLLVDDKGTISIITFGAPPFAHADDPLRAVRCALDLQALAARLGLRLAVGITTGQVFTGPVGSSLRREYTVMGDPVNLAARLMQVAGPGAIVCDHTTYFAAGNELRWEILAPQMVKGRAAPVRCYSPTGLHRARGPVPGASRLIGRAAEAGRMRAALDTVIAGQAEVLLLEGEAGIGKTRLLLDLVRQATAQGLAPLYGAGHSIDHQTPYLAWRAIFAAYFDLDQLAEAPPAAQRAYVLGQLGEVAPQLVERAGLLNDLLNLDLAESELVQALDPKLRQASLTALLIDLLLLRASARPLVLVLEDAQWLDPLSWKLAERVARTFQDAPLLLVIVYQPLRAVPEDHVLHRLRRLANHVYLSVDPLSAEEAVRVAAARLAVPTLPQQVARLIERTAGGNPFVAEELALSLFDAGIIGVADGECRQERDLAEIHIPDTVQGLVLSRIDRLGPTEQLTLKVAAVIGRVFGAAVLESIYPARLDPDGLSPALERLIGADLIGPLQSYSQLRSHAFKQAMTQEVSYSTLLQTQRRALHARVARNYEQQPADVLPELYALLVHHWHQAGNSERELHYAELAARRFAAEYANQAALTYLGRALELSDAPAQRGELLWLQLQIHERLGDREAQRADVERLEELAGPGDDPHQRAQICNAWGSYYLMVSDYPAALAALERARDLTGEADGEIAARTLTLLGQVREFQGDYRAARGHYTQALELYRALRYPRGESNNLQYLGNVSWYLGEYSAAHSYDQAALAIKRAIGDRSGEAACLTNLAQSAIRRGDLDTARAYLQQALALAEQIGDRGSEAFSHAVIGESYLLSGDLTAAERHFRRAIPLLRAVGDRRREANTLNLLGQIYRDLGDFGASRVCCEQALAIQQDIGEHSYAAYTCLNLCSVVAATDADAARAYCERGLRLAQEASNRDAEAYALAYRAWLAELGADWPGAEAGYLAAIAIRDELQATAAACEDRAGLARVALARGDLLATAAWASACAEYLRAHGSAGVEFPFRIHLTLYDTFRALGDEAEAGRWLAEAYALLNERAAAVGEPTPREQMFWAVPEHSRIRNEWLGRPQG